MKVPRWKRHCIYLPIAWLTYLIAGGGVLAAAKEAFDGEVMSAGNAIQQFGSPAFWLPIIGAELLAVEIAHHDGDRKAAVIFCMVVVVLLWLIYDGALGSFHALAQEKWTAAGLSAGFVVIWSGGVLFFAALLAGGTKWKYGGKDDT